mgnify:CR=1 FL=1
MLERELGNRYTVALTLLPAAPDLFTSVGAKPMYLGLDLRGGVHFLMEVDMNSVARRAQERYVADIRAALRKESMTSRISSSVAALAVFFVWGFCLAEGAIGSAPGIAFFSPV